MRIRQTKNVKQDKALTKTNSLGVDPRLILEGDAFLWENPYSSHGLNYPILTGHINIPIRLIKAIYEHQQVIIINGEECLRLNISLWEANPQNYINQKSPPFYLGRIQTCAKVIDGEVGERLVNLFNKSIKARTLTELSFIAGENNGD